MPEPVKFKAYITLYALTVGVFIVDGAVQSSQGIIACPGKFGSAYYHKPHWHRTEVEARIRVIEMITAKRKSIEKTLKKLHEYEFKIVDHK